MKKFRAGVETHKPTSVESRSVNETYRTVTGRGQASFEVSGSEFIGHVDAAGIVEQRPHERFSITVAYDDSGSVRSLLESEAVEFEAEYEAEVTFAVRVPKAEASALRDQIRSATSGRATLSTSS